MSTTSRTREDIAKELTGIFHNVFDDDRIVLSDSMTAADIPEWDSLNHINLVVATEQHFEIKFKTSEVAKMANVGEFIEAIASKLQR